ncbi:LCP family protein [Calothrix sp. UHCC 0171]|uniref:LCP family protein n=1 Tax=Calothrix sp. UHCC 0171 TaxID=3110245 RepID=UPI002B1ED5B7|nr:LCP family protein [Calothrix sp. UHCC 0171]MEA5573746.1 LCP family protein [Calothrix sp. UHCC 0171]
MVKQVGRQEDWLEDQEIRVHSESSPDVAMATYSENIARKSSGTEGSIPSQLYQRLGLSIPRWLFWILTISVGFTLSGLLVSALALWTPLWSTVDRSDEELQWSGKEAEKTQLPADVWSNIAEYKLTRPMNILVMGIEPVPNSIDGSPESFSGKSDTMLLIRLDPQSSQNPSIRVLSIPKDTMIAIPEKGLNKVADANAQGGPVLAARVISRTLNNTPIDRYIRISPSGLRQLVDQLGGVEVFVPASVENQSSSQGVSANLVKGWQNLNGEQAEEFARFREAKSGDLPRVQRQQALLKALRERLSSPTITPRLPQLIRVMRKYFDTNLKIEEMMAIVNFSATVERDNFQMTMLPGIFSRLSADPDSYWIDLTGQVKLLSDYTGVTIAGMQPKVIPVPNLKIAVQNAAAKPEVTAKVLNALKQKGFAKAYAAPDWLNSQHDTQIIVQKGDRSLGEQVQKALGLGQVEVAATGELESDVTIRIGKDWK